MEHLRFALETLLFAVLVIAYPVWDAVLTRRLRANAADVHARTGGYIQTLAILWITAFAAIAIRGVNQLVTAPARPAWLPSTAEFVPIAIGLFVGLTVPLVALRFRKRQAGAENALARQLENLAWFLPVTDKQRRLWIAVSITAGICEEVLFRGFALRYLMEAPIALAVIPAVAVSSIGFGINHGYQGIVGIIGTAVLGAVLALLFLATGNLALPIVVHALIDLRVLLLPRGSAMALTGETSG